MSQIDPVRGIPCLLHKDMIRDSISKMKKRKAARPSGLVSEMVKEAGETGVEMIIDLVKNHIIVRVIPAEWKLSTIVNRYAGEGGLELPDQILKITETIIEKLIRQQVGTDEMQFGFRPGYGTINTIYILRQFQDKYLAKKKNIG